MDFLTMTFFTLTVVYELLSNGNNLVLQTVTQTAISTNFPFDNICFLTTDHQMFTRTRMRTNVSINNPNGIRYQNKREFVDIYVVDNQNQIHSVQIEH